MRMGEVTFECLTLKVRDSKWGKKEFGPSLVREKNGNRGKGRVNKVKNRGKRIESQSHQVAWPGIIISINRLFALNKSELLLSL
ncbi:hypothetical protein VNO80_21660 [Phaseolus coccineus]|uniref:Uncharacterized protein n=1 Tax=Phaseolus coccineus TaxID=3886 RepID=A0AAN9QXX5_PHACN